jgi:hypothetical protein
VVWVGVGFEGPELSPPMDVQQTIDRLCRNYGVARSFGERVRPLIERASACEPEKRARLLGLVERSFAEEALRAEKKRAQKLTKREFSALKAVADTLHAWDPPSWFEDWSSRPGEQGNPSS